MSDKIKIRVHGSSFNEKGGFRQVYKEIEAGKLRIKILI